MSSKLRLVRSRLSVEVTHVEVLSVETEDGTWLFDKIKLHTRKGIIVATCDTQVMSQVKLTTQETQDENN